MSENILRKEEKAIFDLRGLYETYGYKKYRMSKFEEYDLYAENRSFLTGGNIITFNDTHGKLLALKPDVTLSIVKNAADGVRLKEYYNENVYRAVDGEYKEIMQVGIESIGEIDMYSLCEVVMLAKKSLRKISAESILDISSAAFIKALLDSTDIRYDVREKLLSCAAAKNTHDIEKTVCECGIDKKIGEALENIVSLYGKPEDILPKAQKYALNDEMNASLKELCGICSFLKSVGEGDGINIDFSLINDMNYYNGIIFKGFIKGVASSVLSGGRYDKLLSKMGKNTGAVGFAIYMNVLDLFFDDKREYDADILVTYNDGADIVAMTHMVNTLTSGGRSVRVQKTGEGAVKCREHFNFTNGGLELANS